MGSSWLLLEGMAVLAAPGPLTQVDADPDSIRASLRLTVGKFAVTMN